MGCLPHSAGGGVVESGKLKAESGERRDEGMEGWRDGGMEGWKAEKLKTEN